MKNVYSIFLIILGKINNLHVQSIIIDYRYNYVKLGFDSLVHLDRLDEIYSGLSGVRYASRNRVVGDLRTYAPRKLNLV